MSNQAIDYETFSDAWTTLSDVVSYHAAFIVIRLWIYEVVNKSVNMLNWVSFAHWMHRKVYICVQKGEAFYQSNNWLLGHMYRKYKLSPPDCVGNKKWWFVFIYEFYVRRLSQNRDRLELNEIKFAEDYAATSTSTPVLTMIETELEKFIEEEVIELRILFSSEAWITSPHFTEVLKFDRLKGH